MNRKVVNGSTARIFRNISFILLLLASFILGVKSLVSIDWNLLNNIFNPINNFINNELNFINDYLYLILFLGLLGLLWTQTNNLFTKIFVTVVSLIVILINDNMPGGITVIDFLPNLNFINKLLDDLVMKHNWVLLVIRFLPLLFIYLTLNRRIPQRLSLSSISSGLGFLLLTLVFINLPTLIENDWHTKTWFITTNNVLTSASFVFIAVGSVLGLIGFFRR